MINFYCKDEKIFKIDENLKTISESVVWFDLLSPDESEISNIESYFEIELPSIEEMHEIESSSRFYKKDNAVFMTATIITNSETDTPQSSSITFILKENKLITLRYDTPKSFSMFIEKHTKKSSRYLINGEKALLGLIESFIDRLSDVLEWINRDIESLSLSTFQSDNEKKLRTDGLQKSLFKIGKLGDLNGKVRETLMSLSKLLRFFSISIPRDANKKNKIIDQIYKLTKDVSSLADHGNFLSNKITFLLDATLGLISIEQNSIIKIFSVAAVIFLPPTLIASIYGMNFSNMPELSTKYGYPIAIIAMIFSSIIPYLYFKSKKWL